MNARYWPFGETREVTALRSCAGVRLDASRCRPAPQSAASSSDSAAMKLGLALTGMFGIGL